MSVDRVKIVHALEGTRSLLLGTALLLVAATLEPALPATFPRWVAVVLALGFLGLGLVTLPRQGVRAQVRALALADDPDWRPIAKRLPWLGLAVFFLLPRLFLAMYGIPHLNPLAGIVPQQWLIRLATVFLFFVMLVPILYMHAGRRKGRAHLGPLLEGDPNLRRRDTLIVGMYLMLIVWSLLLRPFWAPFSLLQWPPELWSLTAGARGIAAVAFAVVPPVVLFMALAANVALARRLASRERSLARDKAMWAAAAHIVLALTAAFLHGYDLLWIARYESLAQF